MTGSTPRGANAGIDAAPRGPEFERDLNAAGFSKHTIIALVYGSDIQTIEELRTRPWGEPGDSFGLHWQLSMRRNLGASGIAEVLAFRESGDPRGAAAPKQAQVVVLLDPAMAADLDAWIADRPDIGSRREAVRTILAAEIASKPRLKPLEQD